MNKHTLKIVYTALFAALICAGSLMAIPIGPVPIVLQNAFAVLAGLLLGPIQGAIAVALFLLIGGLGLPVFSGGRGGFAIFAGPTGGYLIGYFVASIIAGLIMLMYSENKGKQKIIITSLASLTAFVAIYIPGVLLLKHALSLSFKTALIKGLVPFLVGDLIKMVILIPITLNLKPVIARYLSPNA